MNNVQLLGNLVRDPEVRYTQTGKAVASFTVAATDGRKYIDKQMGEEKETVAFIHCVAWGAYANGVGQMRKGQRVFIHGRLQTRSYEAKDGGKRYVTEVIASFVGASLKALQALPSNFDSFSQNPEKEELKEELEDLLF